MELLAVLIEILGSHKRVFFLNILLFSNLYYPPSPVLVKGGLDMKT